MGPSLPMGATRSAPVAQCTGVPGHPLTGRRTTMCSSYTPSDSMLDVQPTEDAFETRRAVMAAVQDHVLRKAVYMGLFRRPE